MDGLRSWFKDFDEVLNYPLSPPRGDYTNEIEFSMKAYLESLWDPAEQKWWTSKGGPSQMSYEAIPPHYVLHMKLAADLTKNAELKTKLQEKVSFAVKNGGILPQGEDLGFTYGDPVAALSGLQGKALALLDSMRPDGSWRFKARVETGGIFKGMDYGRLPIHKDHGIVILSPQAKNLLCPG